MGNKTGHIRQEKVDSYDNEMKRGENEFVFEIHDDDTMKVLNFLGVTTFKTTD